MKNIWKTEKSSMHDFTIVYAFSGELYAELTSVSMTSVMLNNRERKIHFVLLVDSEYRDYKGVFDGIKEFTNCDLSFVYLDKSVFKDAELHIPHINYATYFRLRLPELLPEIDKCLYLDCDTIVNSDLSELFDIELGDNLVGGVLAPGYINNPKSMSYCAKVGLKDLETYVNAGVLLFNLKLMKEENTSSEFMKYISFDYPSQDQDIINKVCYGRVLLLSAKFNVMTKYATWSFEEYGETYNYDELIYAWNFPVIIHYADKIKPWDEPDSYLASEWWEVCCKTKVYDNFIYNAGKHHVFKSLYDSSELIDGKIKKRVPRLYSLKNKRIVLYGAGNFANAFINLYRPLGIEPEYIIVSKKESDVEELQGIKIKELCDISMENEEISLVLAMSDKFQKQVIPMLASYRFREILPLTDNMLSLEKKYMFGWLDDEESVTNGKYVNCISLGCNCAVAMGLRAMGLRRKSGPFDWIISDYQSVVSCIENGFERFVSREVCFVDGNNGKKFINEKYNFIFPHDIKENFEAEYEDILAKYDRRIKTFFEMITEPTVFFRFIKDYDEVLWINQYHSKVDKLLKGYNSQNRIIYLVLNNGWERSINDGVEYVRLIRDKHSGDAKELYKYLIESPEVVSFCSGLINSYEIEKNKLFTTESEKENNRKEKV